jgi:hypothetical protein
MVYLPAARSGFEGLAGIDRQPPVLGSGSLRRGSRWREQRVECVSHGLEGDNGEAAG